MKTIWLGLIMAALLSMSACSGMPSIPTLPAVDWPGSTKGQEEAATGAGSAMPGDAQVRGTIGTAAELLAAGREAEAKVILQAILAETPRDAMAQSYLRQIESDPVSLLGEPSAKSYVVQAGDTMSGLADRFLGDGRMFYALSRYNGLTAPNALSVGRVLKLPASAATEAIVSPTAIAPQTAPSKSADSTKANAIRLQALQLLNKGEVPRAVDLLKQAVALDSNDAAIRKDLERAERIQSALKKG